MPNEELAPIPPWPGERRTLLNLGFSKAPPSVPQHEHAVANIALLLALHVLSPGPTGPLREARIL